MSKQLTLEVFNGNSYTLLANRAVYIVGYDTNSGNAKVDYADASDNTKQPPIGIIQADITSGTSGLITEYGLITGLDTSQVKSNTAVYLGLTGQLLLSPPPVFLTSQQMGLIVYSHKTQGIILIQQYKTIQTITITPSSIVT